MTNHIGLVYTKIETQQLGLVWLCAVCDGNRTGQRRDQSYRCGLRRLSCCDWLDQVSFVKKTKQDNKMTDRTIAVYVENDIELSCLIGSGVNCDENQIEQLCD